MKEVDRTAVNHLEFFKMAASSSSLVQDASWINTFSELLDEDGLKGYVTSIDQLKKLILRSVYKHCVTGQCTSTS